GVSAENVLEDGGTWPPPFSNSFVMSIPPSKKSGGTTSVPTPLVASAVGHLVLMVLLNGSVPEFVVAQIPSLVPPVAFLQSPPSPIGCSLQPPAFGFALSCGSMQPVAPPAQR